jgi:hypothetical protein
MIVQSVEQTLRHQAGLFVCPIISLLLHNNNVDIVIYSRSFSHAASLPARKFFWCWRLAGSSAANTKKIFSRSAAGAEKSG